MNENSGVHDLPHNIEVEKGFLGTVLKRNRVLSEVLDFLRSEAFFLPIHQQIFETMVEMYQQELPIDDLLLADRLSEKNKLAEVGGWIYLVELSDFAQISINSLEYAKIIHDRFLTREIIRITSDITRKGRESSANLGELIQEAESRIGEIAVRQKTEKFHHIHDISKTLMETLDSKSKSTDPITGIHTGFVDLDKMTSGLQKSDLIIVAARPSMGKTSFALNLATHSAIKYKKACLIFSLEMSKEQIAMRILSSEARLDTEMMRNGNLSADDWTQFGACLTTLQDSPIYINDTPSIQTIELAAIARQLHNQLEDGLSMIVVDYLQLMQSSGKFQIREQAISDISRTLKALAKELNVPVIALAQLNRALESRTNKRPMLSDLRESGSIEQDADIIMFIYRDEVYNEETEDKGIAEVIVGKHRNGTTGVKKLKFIGKYTKFCNLSFQTEPEYLD